MAEGTGLLNRHTGFTGIEGSNPFLSAGHLDRFNDDDDDNDTTRIRSSMDRAPVYGTGG